jgi:hypothetical protein
VNPFGLPACAQPLTLRGNGSDIRTGDGIWIL